VFEVLQSADFRDWFSRLKNIEARARIDARLRRLSLGNAGDAKSVGGGISELRIDYGPGYRVYFTRRGPVLVVVLCGGDKRTQNADIKQARKIASQWKE
jgi:putative addiction module killer protein